MDTPTPDSDTAQLVAQFQTAHRATAKHTKSLAEARQRRRDLAHQLRQAGWSYKQIGECVGITAQAVEGLLKYHARRPSRRTADDAGTGVRGG